MHTHLLHDHYLLLFYKWGFSSLHTYWVLAGRDSAHAETAEDMMPPDSAPERGKDSE